MTKGREGEKLLYIAVVKVFCQVHEKGQEQWRLSEAVGVSRDSDRD